MRVINTRKMLAAAAVAGLAMLAGCSQGGEAATVTSTVTTVVPPAPGTTDQPIESSGPASPGPSTPASPTQQTTSVATSSPTPGSTTLPTSSAAPSSTAPADTELWPDNSMVPHIFFHSLVIDAERAFNDPESGKGYLDYMVSQYEFTRILQQVYDKGYILVSPHQLATVNKNGTVTPKKLMLPKGKTPLVISIDDVSYYEYMEGDGFATNLIIDTDGRVRNTYTDADGNTKIGSYDVMPMVDDFVREHPDFSHDGARGVIALTGYNGVLGYRSSPSEYEGKNPNLAADIATATKVADALKAEGWEFASHSWGHINFTNSSVSRIMHDTGLWKSDVQPIVGKTDMLIYPFGADISGVPKYSGAKFDYLKGQGYSFFFNVDGSTTAWGQWGTKYLREARINIDGISMKAALDGRKVLGAFFDVKSVIDPARPASISGN